jgi:hypothetical protein
LSFKVDMVQYHITFDNCFGSFYYEMQLATYLGKNEMLINHLEDLGDYAFIDSVILTNISYNLLE